MGPELRRLNLAFTYRFGQEAVAGFLAQIPVRSPGIRSLTIDGCDWDASQSTQHISRLLRPLTYLEEVCIVINGLRDISPLVYSLAELPKLQSVTFSSQDRHHTLQWIPTVSSPFPQLNHLAPSGKLQYLRLGDTLQDRSFLHNVAKALELLESTKIWKPWRVWVGKSVNMNDEDMKTVASRLPRLQVLSLIGCEPRINPSITFRSLASVVASCPDLRSLQLQVDGSSKPPNHDLIPHSALLELNLGGSREPLAHEIPAVAAFLDQLSCAKGSPHTAHWKGRPTPDAWCHVFDLIKKLQNTGDRSRGG
ncbi:hypothetical protein FRB95_012985 [Tulasnella sp. JGI-2019a]|nr:hypothetical protein FRB95_012985 [Tulasnella sp. JGI-2019a]